MTTPPALPQPTPPLPAPPRAGFAGAPGGRGPEPAYGYPRTGYRPPLPPAVSPDGQPLASFADRLVARIIDGAILTGIASVVIIPAYLIVFLAIFDDFGTTVTTQRGPFVEADADLVNPWTVVLPLLGLMVLLVALALLLSYLYEVELMFRSGQTIGKRVMRIKIMPVDPASRLTRAAAVKRFLIMHGCGIVPGLGWLDGLWQLWDKPYQQCLHDKVPSTLVIKLNP